MVPIPAQPRIRLRTNENGFVGCVDRILNSLFRVKRRVPVLQPASTSSTASELAISPGRRTTHPIADHKHSVSNEKPKASSFDGRLRPRSFRGSRVVDNN